MFCAPQNGIHARFQPGRAVISEIELGHTSNVEMTSSAGEILPTISSVMISGSSAWKQADRAWNISIAWARPCLGEREAPSRLSVRIGRRRSSDLIRTGDVIVPAHRAPKRIFAASVSGAYREIAVPSGSRNWNVLLPQGIIFSSCTSCTLSLRRSYSAPMSSTWNSI